jgi:hypothetical protein
MESMPTPHERPEDDPAIKAVEETILERANREIAQEQAGKWGTIAKNESTDNAFQHGIKTQGRVARQEWDKFIERHPDKAEKYRGAFPDINDALERKSKKKS